MRKPVLDLGFDPRDFSELSRVTDKIAVKQQRLTNPVALCRLTSRT
jgi:hypothetical protein